MLGYGTICMIQTSVILYIWKPCIVFPFRFCSSHHLFFRSVVWIGQNKVEKLKKNALRGWQRGRGCAHSNRVNSWQGTRKIQSPSNFSNNTSLKDISYEWINGRWGNPLGKHVKRSTECQAFCPVVRTGFPISSPASECCSPFGSRGETHSLVGGDPIRTKEQTLWYSMYSKVYCM